MDLIRITELSDQLGLSSRTLRYYEEAGLIESVRPQYEKYRYYTPENVERLKQIIVLRKMQIPIREIAKIYQSQDMKVLVEAFVRRINEIDSEVTTLSELRQIIDNFLQRMTKNGIKQISAIPLLYEELNKQLEVLESKRLEMTKSSQVTDIRTLNAIDRKLAPPIEVRITKLPEMNMIDSRKMPDRCSKPDELWSLLDQYGYTSQVGEHTIFELLKANGEEILLAKETSELTGQGFCSFHLEGGYFAVASAYADEDLDFVYQTIKNSFDDNPYFKVYYQGDEHFALIESVLSPDGTRERVDVYVPIRSRVPRAEKVSDKSTVNGYTAEELRQGSLILKEYAVRSFTLVENPSYTIHEDGVVEFVSYISTRKLSTDVAVKMPFRVDITFRIDEESARFGYGADEGSIRIDFGNRYFGINMENNADKRKSLEAIKFTEPLTGEEVLLPHAGRIKPNEYNTLTWIIGEKYLAVIINDEVRYYTTELSYMKADMRLQNAQTVMIGSNGQGKRFLKSVKIYQLGQTRKMKGVKLNMATKLSNNQIPTIKKVIAMDHGENYWFNGCARYVMECMGQEDYTYGFFAGLTGDNFTQFYYKEKFGGDSATDYVMRKKGGKYIEQLFNEIGYACSFVSNRTIKSNREMYLQTLLAYIDKGIPVIRYHWFWNVIVGYEDFGKILLVMESDKEEPERIAFENIFDLSDPTSDQEAEENGYGWFFVGEKMREVTLAEAYRNAVQKLLPRLLEDNEVYCFGANAFRAWAEELKSGKFDGMKPEDFDDWPQYTVYVCNLATNSGCGRDFLLKAVELNPDLAFLPEVVRLFARTGDLWNSQGGEDLEAIGGGFNITLETLQDKAKCEKIVQKLLEFAQYMDKVIQILQKNTNADGVLCPVEEDLVDIETEHFVTIDEKNWIPSPFVPQFSGKKRKDVDQNGKAVKCWYIDSTEGRWSTLYHAITGVKKGEKVRLLLWVKFEEAGKHELIIWVTQNDWDKHAEFYATETKPYLLGMKDGYRLMSVVYTAIEDEEEVRFSVSVNDVKVSIYPALESDLLSVKEGKYSIESIPEREKARIVKCYKQGFPPCRFVGIRYKNSDRVNGNFGKYWGEWHSCDRFSILEKLLTKKFKKEYPCAEDYVGLMKNKYGEDESYFEYWIGMFLPPDCEVPEGFDYIDFNHQAAGICWIKGQEDEVFFHENDCYQKLVKNDMTVPSEEDGGCYMFERYNCPRYTTPDERGEVILDLGFFVDTKATVKDISELKHKDEDDRLEYFDLPDARVIGRSFRVLLNRKGAKNPIPGFWKDITKDGSKEVIQNLPKLIPAMVGFTDDYDEKTNTFLYIAGVICPEDTEVPEGYTYRDIPATIVSKSRYNEWLKECNPIWKLDGYEWSGAPGQYWNAELYLDEENNKRFRLLCAVMPNTGK